MSVRVLSRVWDKGRYRKDHWSVQRVRKEMLVEKRMMGSEGGAWHRAEISARKRAWVGVGPRVKLERRRESWWKIAKAAKKECGV